MHDGDAIYCSYTVVGDRLWFVGMGCSLLKMECTAECRLGVLLSADAVKLIVVQNLL